MVYSNLGTTLSMKITFLFSIVKGLKRVYSSKNNEPDISVGREKSLEVELGEFLYFPIISTTDGLDLRKWRSHLSQAKFPRKIFH